MIVNLRVYAPKRRPRLFEKWRKPRPEPEVEEKIYTPATLDLSIVSFAYVDNEGDIVVHKKGDSDAYALQYSDDLFCAINEHMSNNYRRVTGFVNNDNAD